MADLTFAKHTNAILNMLPYWFNIRKHSKESIGARFLNISGLELDDMRYVLDYAYQQCYITTADINQIDFCYKSIIPMPFKLSNAQAVFANNTGLIKAKNLKQFFGVDQHGIKDKELHSFQYYYLDEEHNIIYVRQKFNVDAIYDTGKIKIVFKNGSEHLFRLIPHQVWNFFDEIGALVSCPRIFEEPNIEYKERIMDVFKNKANASKYGLINGIARELAIRRTVTWEKPFEDLELEDPMIVLNSIQINNEYVALDRILMNADGCVVIKADKEYDVNMPCEVSYVYGLEMHQLYNHDDIKFYNELFTVEGKAKPKLLEYINILNSESPIFWDDFHWNEHYWNQNEPTVSGLGYIPHLYDGSISGFKNYKG